MPSWIRPDEQRRINHATTDLQLALRARVDEAAGATLHLDGTSLRIDDVEVAATRAKGPHAKPWKAKLKIADGALTLPVSAQDAEDDPIPSVAKVLRDQGFGALLASADRRLSATLTVSGLDWIAELLNRPLDLSLTGSGELDAEIVLADDWPARDATLTIPREALSMALMEHRVDGQGEASLRVEKGGKHPRLRLAVALDDGRMRRRDEPEPSIGEVRMDARILVSDPLAASGGTSDVTLEIHSARVPDMSTYNAYLPAHPPLSLISGEASLVGDFHFTPDSATGDLDGHINLTLDGKSAVLSDAILGSERISVGAKGRADADTREGMVYARWRNLTGVLALKGEEKHFDLIDARAKFDAYVPGTTALAEQDLRAEAEGLGKPTAAATVGAIPSPKVDNAPTEPENLFLNEDL